MDDNSQAVRSNTSIQVKTANEETINIPQIPEDENEFIAFCIKHVGVEVLKKMIRDIIKQKEKELKPDTPNPNYTDELTDNTK